MRYAIHFWGHCCTVDTSLNLYEKLHPILEPYMRIEAAEAVSSGKVHFHLEMNPTAVMDYARQVEGAPALQLHCDLDGRIHYDSTTAIIYVHELRVAYVLERSGGRLAFRYVYDEFTSEVELDFMRIARGTLIALAEASGWRKAHMAVVGQGGCGVAFIGGEGAGKTSFMLSFLTQLEHARLITNDKALLAQASDSGNMVEAYGLPYAVSIGAGALTHLPIEVNSETRIINEEAYFWPREVAQRLERETSRRIALQWIFHVRIVPEQQGLTCSVVHHAEERRELLLSHVLRFSDRITPSWLNRWLDVTVSPVSVPESLLTVPMLRVEGNPWNGGLQEMWRRLQQQAANSHRS